MSLALSTSFRGRGLKGCVLNLPAGYTGYVMKEEKRPFTEEEVRICRRDYLSENNCPG